jgi:hypothetical protein
MAEEKVEVRDVNFRQVLPWTELFRGFQVALDPKKMFLAACGIVVMSAGWFLLSVLFAPSNTPPAKDPEVLEERISRIREKYQNEPAESVDRRVADATRQFEADHQAAVNQWKLLQWTAGEPGAPNAPPEGGTLRTMPWNENRGPNPYLALTSDRSQDWTLRQQVYVLLEPLVKFLRPIRYLLNPAAGFKAHVFFLLALLWTVATWALFGGAITRMAAVQLTRKEKIGISEALRFAWARYVSFLSAPLFPLLIVVGLIALLMVYGFLHLIPVLGDVFVDGIGWFLVLCAGGAMAILLVGLVGWPLMYATISVEGSDSFDALSRSYSYVYQCPWHYLWNCVVAVVYGAALIFFVGFMGSLMVYLGKWGVGQTPFTGPSWTDRDPSYLFIYAPESFGWRELLLEGSAYGDPAQAQAARDALRPWNKIGAFMVAVWVYLAFLLVVGFGYSYFWSSSTIIYLLMRRQVDDTDLDEIYLEEDEAEDAYSATVPAPAPSAPSPAPSFQMVDAPTLRTAPPAPAPPKDEPPGKAEAPATPAHGEDGAAPGL